MTAEGRRRACRLRRRGGFGIEIELPSFDMLKAGLGLERAEWGEGLQLDVAIVEVDLDVAAQVGIVRHGVDGKPLDEQRFSPLIGNLAVRVEAADFEASAARRCPDEDTVVVNVEACVVPVCMGPQDERTVGVETLGIEGRGWLREERHST